MAEQTPKLSSVLWSVAGLLVTLFIAWYFSRKSGDAQVAASTASPDQYTFNIGGESAPVIAPPITTPTPAPSACCTRCNGQTQSAGKILSSGMLSQQVFEATGGALKTLVSSGTPLQTAAATGTPIGPTLIPQSNGGLPLPSDSWWTNDALYRQAYVIAYNQTVQQMLPILANQGRVPSAKSVGYILYHTTASLDNMSMSFANDSTPDRAANFAQAQGDAQQKVSNGYPPMIAQAQANSALALQTMTTTIQQWLEKLGDKNISAGNSLALPPDQNVSQFLIN